MNKITKILVLVLAVVMVHGVMPVGAVTTPLYNDSNVEYRDMLNLKPFDFHIDILSTEIDEAATPFALPESQATRTFEHRLGRHGVYAVTAIIEVTYAWSRANSYSEIIDVDVSFNGPYADDYSYHSIWETSNEYEATHPENPEDYRDLKYDEMQVVIFDLAEENNMGYVIINYTIHDNGTFTETPSY